MGEWSPPPARGGSLPAFNVKQPYGAKGDGTTDDTISIQAAVNACVAAGGGTVYLPAGRYKITAAIDLSGLKGQNKGMTFMGAGSGNVFGSSLPITSNGTTLILNYNNGPAITAYGTLAGATANPIVSLNGQGFMVANQQNIGSAFTIDMDYCSNGCLWSDIYVDGGNFTGNGFQCLNTANGGFVWEYCIARHFPFGNGHNDQSIITSHVDVAPQAGNGSKISCQSYDCLTHFQVGQPVGNQFNSMGLYTCKAVNTVDIVGSVGLNLLGNSVQCVVTAFHAERCSMGIVFNGTRGCNIISPIVEYPAGTPWLTTGTINSGLPNLAVADGSFFQNGDPITVAGAGVAAANLVTTVLSGGGSTSLVLNTNASTSVVSANVTGTSACFRFQNGAWGNEVSNARVTNLAYGARYDAGSAGNAVSMYDLSSVGGLTIGTGFASGANQAANQTVLSKSTGRTGTAWGAKRMQARNDGYGILVETVDKNVCSTTLTATSQIAAGVAVGLLAGDVVTGIAMEVTNTPTVITLAKVGLYDSSGNRLAVSSDNSAAFLGGPAHIQTAFTAPYTVAADGLYYLFYLLVFTGTAATILRPAASLASSANAMTNGARPAVQQGGRADLTPTLTFSAGGANVWMAAY